MEGWPIKDPLSYFEEENTDQPLDKILESLPTPSMDMNDPAELDRLYYYEGTNLGARYTKEKTTFRLWAPTAMEAKIVLYSEWNQEEGKEIEMKRSEKGTWAAELSGNQDGLIYTYKVY